MEIYSICKYKKILVLTLTIHCTDVIQKDILFFTLETKKNFFFQETMKETLSKQDIKLEWEDRRLSANSSSPPISRMTAEDQTTGSPQSVITTRRYTRTITATGHITETLTNHPPDSPESNSNSVQQVIQQQQQQQIHVKDENSDRQRYHQEEMQHRPEHVPISPHGSPNQQQVGDQHQPPVIFTISGGQELQVEPAETSEPRKEPPRWVFFSLYIYT